MPLIKTPEQVEKMRKAGLLLQKAQQEMKKHMKEGVSLLELDAIAEEVIRQGGGEPAFLGLYGFPNTLCTAVNQEVVHGIPNNTPLKNGDLVTIDCGVKLDGWYADAAFTLVLGGDDKNPTRGKFEKDVYKALDLACKAAKPGNSLGDLGFIIASSIRKDGYSICKEYTGHGIGQKMHEDPHVYNYGNQGTGMKLKEGMTLCIEPIVAFGKPKTKELSDGWTVVTVDGKDACQWEHCGVVTKDGLDIFA